MGRLRLTLLLSILVAGCGAFSREEANFVAYNTSSDKVVVVTGGEEKEVLAGGSIKFVLSIQVPRGSYGSSEPSNIDKVVLVSLAFRNLRTGILTEPISCTAGAKVVTSVWYETFGPYGVARCTSSY